MKAEIKVDEEFIAAAIEEYCLSRDCPEGCPFDKAGICTETNSFNTIVDRLKEQKNEL